MLTTWQLMYCIQYCASAFASGCAQAHSAHLVFPCSTSPMLKTSTELVKSVQKSCTGNTTVT